MKKPYYKGFPRLWHMPRITFRQVEKKNKKSVRADNVRRARQKSQAFSGIVIKI